MMQVQDGLKMSEPHHTTASGFIEQLLRDDIDEYSDVL